MYYLLPLSLRDILFSEGVLEKCEESKKYNGYYVPEDIYLILKRIFPISRQIFIFIIIVI